MQCVSIRTYIQSVQCNYNGFLDLFDRCSDMSITQIVIEIRVFQSALLNI